MGRRSTSSDTKLRPRVHARTSSSAPGCYPPKPCARDVGRRAWLGTIGGMPEGVVQLCPTAPDLGLPVFVDETGRRWRRLRWVGRAAAACILAYLFLLGASFARAPWAPHLTLPGLGPVLAEPGPGASADLGGDSQNVPAPDLKTTVARPPVASSPPTTASGTPSTPGVAGLPPAAVPTSDPPTTVPASGPGPAPANGANPGGPPSSVPGRQGPQPTTGPTTTVTNAPGRSGVPHGRP